MIENKAFELNCLYKTRPNKLGFRDFRLFQPFPKIEGIIFYFGVKRPIFVLLEF